MGRYRRPYAHVAHQKAAAYRARKAEQQAPAPSTPEEEQRALWWYQAQEEALWEDAQRRAEAQ
jgi:glutamate/tyrosine decarboxylase-like PLP-dependent enzyme